MSREVVNNIGLDQSSKIVDHIESMAGGKNLRELIESGRVLRLNGQRFIPQGQKISYDPNNESYTNEESSVLEALESSEGGVLIFDDLSTENPKPRLLTVTRDGHDIRTLSVSDPLNKDDIEDEIENFLEDKTIPDKDAVDVPLPGLGNRIWDSILRLFGSNGTDEMIEYRIAKNYAVNHYNECLEVHSAFEGAEKRIQANSKELADMTRAERNYNNEMEMVKQAMIPSAMGAVPEDQAFYNEFVEAMTNAAKDNYKVRAMIVQLGMETITTDGHRHPSQLRQVYQAYKTERANGRELDLKDMMEAAVNKPEKTGNLKRILTGQKIIPQQVKENVL